MSRMHNDPRLFPPVLGLIIAALFVALAWKTELPIWLRFTLVMAAIFIAVASVFSLIDWIAYEATLRLDKLKHAQVNSAVSLAYAVKGLTPAQVEFIQNQVQLEILGVPGDQDLFWRVRFPGGDVEIEFVEAFLRASLEECPDPYLWPVREHSSARYTFWREYSNIEEKLRIVTDGLVYWGKAEKASGRYAAKLKPGVTYKDLADLIKIEL
jgi:hypothetical protein